MKIMELREYLDKIAECPDEFVDHKDESSGDATKIHKLTADLGVYDNWPILLNSKFSTVVNHFMNPTHTLDAETKKDGKINYVFNYNPGSTVSRVANFVEPGFFEWCGLREEVLQNRWRESDFNTTIMLHPYQGKMLLEKGWEKKMASVISDFGKFALKEKIPLVFPRSVGWSNPEDYSGVVQHRL